MRGLRWSAGFVMLLGLTALVAQADVVRVKDGSVLHGEVTKLKDGEVTLDTDYADDVLIDADHIVTLETKGSFRVRFRDGTELEGPLVVKDGKIAVGKAPAPEPDAKEESAPTKEEAAAPAPTEQPPGAQVTEAVEVPREPSVGAPETAEPPFMAFEDVYWIEEVEAFFRYDGDMNIGVNFARGNTDTTDIHMDGALEPAFGLNEFKFAGAWNRKENRGDTTESNWRLFLTYQREIRHKWFVSGFNTYENDQFKDLDLRATIGGGLGYKFWDQDERHLEGQLGIGYVNENFSDAANLSGTPDRQYPALRWALDFDHDVYTDDIVVYHNHVFLWDFLQTNNWNLLTVAGLKFELISDFSLSAEYQFDWDNAPAAGKGNDDSRFILKVGYEFNGDQNDWWQ